MEHDIYQNGKNDFIDYKALLFSVLQHPNIKYKEVHPQSVVTKIRIEKPGLYLSVIYNGGKVIAKQKLVVMLDNHWHQYSGKQRSSLILGLFLYLFINCSVRLDFVRLPDSTAIHSHSWVRGLYVIPPPAKKKYYTAETQSARRKKILIFFRIP